jgi:hypothetical protein
LPLDFRNAPFATEIARRCNMSRWANSGLMHRSRERAVGWLPRSHAEVCCRFTKTAVLRSAQKRASTPSSAPCLTVKFFFIPHQRYRQYSLGRICHTV